MSPARKQVVVTFAAFEEILAFTAQHASNKIPRARWAESMGFLFCRRDEEANEYVVADAVGMTSGDEMAVNIAPAQLGNIEKLEEERADRGLFLGGWFHTHPGLSLFYSDTDCQNQLFYQQFNEDGLGIVFDHTMVAPDFIGFSIFRLKSKDALDEYEEVPYELRDFTLEGLLKTLVPFGVGEWVVRELAAHLDVAPATYEEDLPPAPSSVPGDPDDVVAEATEQVESALERGDTGEALLQGQRAYQAGKTVDDEETRADGMLALLRAYAGASCPRAAWNLLEEFELYADDHDLPYADYYRGALAAVKAELHQRDGNVAGALEELQRAARHFTTNENYVRAHECNQARVQQLTSIGASQLALAALQESLETVRAALGDPEEDEPTWREEERRLTEKHASLQAKVRSSGLQRVV